MIAEYATLNRSAKLLPFTPPNEPLMENTRAHQKHQDLIIGNRWALIHCFKTVEKIYDLALIEVHGGENSAAKRVLHERTESFLGIQGGGAGSKTDASASCRQCH